MTNKLTFDSDNSNINNKFTSCIGLNETITSKTSHEKHIFIYSLKNNSIRAQFDISINPRYISTICVLPYYVNESTYDNVCTDSKNIMQPLIEFAMQTLLDILPNNKTHTTTKLAKQALLEIDICVTSYCSKNTADYVTFETIDETNDRFHKVSKEVNGIHNEMKFMSKDGIT